MARILFCGGRDFNDLSEVVKAFEEHTPTFVITGGAKGADTLADKVAKDKGIDRVVYPANWVKYGKSAGYRRNSLMLKEGKPDLVVAFKGGKGTEMMISLAEKEGIPTHRFGFNEETGT